MWLARLATELAFAGYRGSARSQTPLPGGPKTSPPVNQVVDHERKTMRRPPSQQVARENVLVGLSCSEPVVRGAIETESVASESARPVPTLGRSGDRPQPCRINRERINSLRRHGEAVVLGRCFPEVAATSENRMPAQRSFQLSAHEAVLGAFRTGVSLYRVIRYTRQMPRPPEPGRPDSTAVILGNGPSLFGTIEEHVEWLAQTHCYCVSMFATTPFFERIRPKSYVFADHGWWEDVVCEENVNDRTTLFKAIAERTRWPLTLHFPVEAKASTYFRNSIASLPSVEIRFYNSTRLASFNRLVFELYRWQLGLPTGGNVLVSALYLALTAGLRRLYLVGADHSWLEDLRVDANNIVCLRQKHFTGDDDVELKPFIKFHDASEYYTLPETLQRFADLFNGYYDISRYAGQLGARIVNATPNSYIDAFERGRLPRSNGIPIGPSFASAVAIREEAGQTPGSPGDDDSSSLVVQEP
jgi:hypothetical protein